MCVCARARVRMHTRVCVRVHVRCCARVRKRESTHSTVELVSDEPWPRPVSINIYINTSGYFAGFFCGYTRLFSQQD